MYYVCRVENILFTVVFFMKVDNISSQLLMLLFSKERIS